MSKTPTPKAPQVKPVEHIADQTIVPETQLPLDGVPPAEDANPPAEQTPPIVDTPPADTPPAPNPDQGTLDLADSIKPKDEVKPVEVTGKNPADSVPSLWTISPLEGDQIEGYNSTSRSRFTGTIAEFNSMLRS
jgi:hypothetical protein